MHNLHILPNPRTASIASTLTHKSTRLNRHTFQLQSPNLIKTQFKYLTRHLALSRNAHISVLARTLILILSSKLSTHFAPPPHTHTDHLAAVPVPHKSLHFKHRARTNARMPGSAYELLPYSLVRQTNYIRINARQMSYDYRIYQYFNADHEQCLKSSASVKCVNCIWNVRRPPAECRDVRLGGDDGGAHLAHFIC